MTERYVSRNIESKLSDIEKNEKQQKESEEDLYLQNQLNILIESLKEKNPELHLSALESLRQIIRFSTTSITSVPKPLKYLRQHYETMKHFYIKCRDKKIKKNCADIMSVLAMTMADEDSRECLSYRLQSDENIDICSWGHEYIRHLSSEIVSEWINTKKNITRDNLMLLIQKIIPFTLSHNAEVEACDLLMEIEKLPILLDYVDENSYSKISLYLLSSVPYAPEPENEIILEFLIKMALNFNNYYDAVRISLMFNNNQRACEAFNKCQDEILQMQIAFLFARQRSKFEINANSNDKITEIMSNSLLNQYFSNLAQDLDILDAKSPEDVFKSHLENNQILSLHGKHDSARLNLAASFVNGFLNTGFGNDKMFDDYGVRWIYKNKDHGMTSATASLGLIKLWDIDGGLAAIDRYLYSNNNNIKSGALLACGILNCGVRNEIEPAHALLSDYLENETKIIQTCAILGIGIAYAGSDNYLALNSLRNLIRNNQTSLDIIGPVAISIGLIAVGSCSAEDTELLLEQAANCDEFSKPFHYIRAIFLGLALLYLGKQMKCEVVVESLHLLREPFKTYGIVTVEMCAYAGTGNVLKIQEFLHICTRYATSREKEHKIESKKFSFKEVKMAAVIGIALISIGDEIGIEMTFRTLGHIMRYSESKIRRVVPLAMALIYISNPKTNVADMLNKFSHDNDIEVVLNAIFSLGLIGAGTNNAKIANLLRLLAQYYVKENYCLFIVRLAQGLIHLAKGTVTLSPFHSEHTVLKPCSIAAILNVIFVAFDMKNLILGHAHYLLYLITPAIEVRALITLDENLKQIQVPVRTGLALDIVAQAGKPKTITGFRTNTTPILLEVGHRAELATDEYTSLSPVLEGFVILRRNC